MSRIHDALKKAEEEKSAGLPPSGAGASPEPGESGSSRSRVPEAGSGGSAATTLGGAPGAPALITLEVLESRCSKPQWKPNPRTALVFGSQNHAVGMEEFRTLRSRLYLIREKQLLRTLLIISALPLEGKTFVSANLAQVLVRQRERRVLLIDADLRRSQLHSALGAPVTPGLSEYLQGGADELSIVQRGPQGNLFFIPAGDAVANPAELIANGRLGNLIQRLTPIFDWIILDSPPAIPVSDASLLAELCDGLLLVIRADATPYDLARKVGEEFRAKRLLGVVLNRATPGSGYSPYYYGAGHPEAARKNRKPG